MLSRQRTRNGTLIAASTVTVLQEGRPSDILAYIDGALLVDLWDDLVLPRAVRSAWAPLVSPSGEAQR